MKNNCPNSGTPTDMLATAREAQWSALTFMGPDSIKVVAPAKVNLFLDVRNRRPDGYHNVVNIMHTLALHDVLYMSWEPDTSATSETSLQIYIDCVVKSQGTTDSTCNHFPIDNLKDSPENNLVYKAVSRLFDAADLRNCQNGTMRIRIEKHIPMQAGLGGGSSDAAAALVGAAKLWGLDFASTEELLADVAKTLGADVAFFLQGGCACYENVGDRKTRTYVRMNKPVVLVKPPSGVSTARAYAAFDNSPTPIDNSVLDRAMSAEDASEIPLANNLTSAALSVTPEISNVLALLENHVPNENILLCGSGSSVFAITNLYADALKIAAEAQRAGYWSKATTFSGLKAAVV